MSAIAADVLIPAGTWKVDPAHSRVEFSILHMGLVDIRGRAPAFEATITGGDEPHIEGIVETSSLSTDDEQRDGHLASPEFFDAERYPQLRFASTNVRAEGDALIVAGELTIKGITRPAELRGLVTGSGTDPYGNERIGLELSGTVDREEFGLRWNAPLPGGGFVLPNEATLSATFSAVKAG